METEALFNQQVCMNITLSPEMIDPTHNSIPQFSPTLSSFFKLTHKYTVKRLVIKLSTCCFLSQYACCNTQMNATFSGHSAHILPVMYFPPRNICTVTQASLSCVYTSNKAINHLNRPQLTPPTPDAHSAHHNAKHPLRCPCSHLCQTGDE